MAFTGQSTGRGSGTGWFDMNGQMTEIPLLLPCFTTSSTHYFVCCLLFLYNKCTIFDCPWAQWKFYIISYWLLMRIYCSQLKNAHERILWWSTGSKLRPKFKIVFAVKCTKSHSLWCPSLKASFKIRKSKLIHYTCVCVCMCIYITIKSIKINLWPFFQ